MSNYVTNNNNTVCTSNGRLIINGENITIPRSLNTNIIVNVGGKVYVGGYEFFPHNKKLKRTIKAFLRCYIF